ncbi:pyrroline-5-carboxylate reductase [Spiroplasma sp. BIUS-1]|uniref:pyrroline-5-carboxylate reductase family protein n=1 Tax=Spiroplasma sp. BIUS-1 TaxID=216964 RepID=UPI001396F726|nr:pyrroline-5-carboxylate reductase dimerization domain-containing protein [Spiroplasma sp. BIUS-1]QHX36986.1 pyrroline-5-carboxylate reductase [Spiroplasma sp. BIUS-1]
MKKALFIGLGHMGSSLLKGILNNKNFKSEIYGYDAIKETQQKVVGALKGLGSINNLDEIITNNIDVIVIGVRPESVDDICLELNKLDLSNKTIVCMANAVDLKRLENNFKEQENISLVRMMPNMNASVGESVTALAYKKIDSNKLDFIVKMFESCGIVEIIDESNFATLTSISGCLPSYVFSFFKGITDYALEKGFEKEQAFRIVQSAITGSIKSIENSNVDLKTMIDQICVPNGSTIEGQKVLEENGFEDIIKKCLQAAENKATSK